MKKDIFPEAPGKNRAGFGFCDSGLSGRGVCYDRYFNSVRIIQRGVNGYCTNHSGFFAAELFHPVLRGLSADLYSLLDNNGL